MYALGNAIRHRHAFEQTRAERTEEFLCAHIVVTELDRSRQKKAVPPSAEVAAASHQRQPTEPNLYTGDTFWVDRVSPTAAIDTPHPVRVTSATIARYVSFIRMEPVIGTRTESDHERPLNDLRCQRTPRNPGHRIAGTEGDLFPPGPGVLLGYIVIRTRPSPGRPSRLTP